MATIADLATMTTVGSGDYLVVSDSGVDKKIDATLVPWTNTISYFARQVSLNLPNNSGEAGFNVEVTTGVASNQRAYRWAYNGTVRGYISVTAATNQFLLNGFDNGSGDGPNIVVGHNSNASTPAAGYIHLINRGGTGYRIWPDATGLLRIHTANPTSATDTAGTVVGAQTSSKDAKTQRGKPDDAAAILAHIAEGAKAVRRFVYKNGAFGGEEFSGLIVDYAPRYGMDADADHPAGKSLNVPNAIGDLMIAVDYLARRVAALEADHA